MHVHMIVIGYYICHTKYKCGATCVTHFRYWCDVREIDLVMDSFLS